MLAVPSVISVTSVAQVSSSLLMSSASGFRMPMVRMQSSTPPLSCDIKTDYGQKHNEPQNACVNEFLTCYPADTKLPQADDTFFQRREFCFTLDGDIFVRYQSFKVIEVHMRGT